MDDNNDDELSTDEYTIIIIYINRMQIRKNSKSADRGVLGPRVNY